MENNTYLKPCPFCGGASLKVEMKKSAGWRQSYRYTASVRCNKCHARGGTAWCDSLCDASEAKGRAAINWNYRQREMEIQMED